MKVLRREFIVSASALALFGCKTARDDDVAVRFGMVMDLHYAKLPVSGSGPLRRCYEQSVEKLRRCVETMNRRQVDFLIELGDFTDQRAVVPKPEVLSCLDEIESEFRRFEGPCYHLLGNHDNEQMTKREFLAHVANAGQAMTSGHYSFAVNGVTFIALDANFNSRMEDYAPGNWDWTDANVPDWELDWLERTLAETSDPVIVLGHQRLDPAAEPRHLVKNAAAVRDVIERSGKVLAVLTGHQHDGGFCRCNGIPYYTLRALVNGSLPASNSFAEVEVRRSGRLGVTGYAEALSRDL